MRTCRAGQLIVALFLGRLRPSKRLTSTKRGCPWQQLTTTVGVKQPKQQYFSHVQPSPKRQDIRKGNFFDLKGS